MIANEIFIKSLKGVGDVSINFAPDKKIRVLTGPNGIGKTKSLEAIFQALFFTNDVVGSASSSPLTVATLLFKAIEIQGQVLHAPTAAINVRDWTKRGADFWAHKLPVLFIGSQQRGLINAQNGIGAPIGDFETRRANYIASVQQGMQKNFASLGMDTNIESWFSTRANSANPYQKNEDNRGFEIETVLRALHRIDSRIDPEFIEIDGNGRVYISVDKGKRNLTQLSSGFSSILKIVQTIVAGYGNFSNDLNIEKVKGFVLIDEVDSHLHLSWQSGIVSLLSDIFSNTTFIFTTHSPLVCIGLKKGELYQLKRDDTGVVRSEEVSTPKSAMLVDIIKDGFGVDLNKEKLDNFDWQSSTKAKNALLNLIKE